MREPVAAAAAHATLHHKQLSRLCLRSLRRSIHLRPRPHLRLRLRLHRRRRQLPNGRARQRRRCGAVGMLLEDLECDAPLLGGTARAERRLERRLQRGRGRAVASGSDLLEQRGGGAPFAQRAVRLDRERERGAVGPHPSLDHACVQAHRLAPLLRRNARTHRLVEGGGARRHLVGVGLGLGGGVGGLGVGVGVEALRGATCCAASRARVERASCQRSEAACAVTAAPPARALGGSAAASISE
jgi:hypothetical protein